MDLSILLANEDDLKDIIDIITEAKGIMKEMDIPQWQNPSYPTIEDLKEDLNDNSLYILKKNDELIGTASIFIRDNLRNEDNYQTIFEGKWLNEEAYVVIHRCAIRNKERGNNYINLLFNYATKVAKDNNINNLRIDTHEKNGPMNRAIKKFGFLYCGKVIMLDGTERLAYQYIIE